MSAPVQSRYAHMEYGVQHIWTGKCLRGDPSRAPFAGALSPELTRIISRVRWLIYRMRALSTWVGLLDITHPPWLNGWHWGMNCSTHHYTTCEEWFHICLSRTCAIGAFFTFCLWSHKKCWQEDNSIYFLKLQLVDLPMGPNSHILQKRNQGC